MDTEDKREPDEKPADGATPPQDDVSPSADDNMLPLDDPDDAQEDETQTPDVEYAEHDTHPVDGEDDEEDELDEPPIAPAPEEPSTDRAFRGFLLLAVVVIVALAAFTVAWNCHLVWRDSFFPDVIPKEERGLQYTFYRFSTIQQRIDANPQAAYGYPKGIVIFLMESGLIRDASSSQPADDAPDEIPPNALDSQSE